MRIDKTTEVKYNNKNLDNKYQWEGIILITIPLDKIRFVKNEMLVCGNKTDQLHTMDRQNNTSETSNLMNEWMIVLIRRFAFVLFYVPC